MYLISQLWWFLLLAFLLGALLGYLLWRACGRRRIETHYERSNKELVTRLATLEQERSRFSGAAIDAEGDNAKLKAEIAGLQGKLADTSSRLNAAVDTADAKLKSYVGSVRHREEAMDAEIDKLKKETAELRRTGEADKAAAKAREEKLASDAALAQKSAADVQRKHAEDLRAAEERWADEVQKKHAAELKKFQEQAKHNDTKVLALTHSDKGARQELEDSKVRHAADLKKAREDAAAEAARKLGEDAKKARDQALAEAQAKHAEELKKVREQAKSELSASHAAELKKVREEAAAEAAKKHAEDLKKIRDDAAAAAKRGHDDELARFKREAVAFVSPAPGPAASPASSLAPGTVAPVDPALAVTRGKKLASGWRPDREIGEKPAGLTILSGPKDGKADDLKLIWGVGPKLGKMLNGAGFFHFAQIAAWGAADIEWVDRQLGEFAGRAVRDKWVEQCRKLATGWRPASDVGEKPE